MTTNTVYSSTEIFQHILKQTLADLRGEFGDLYVEKHPELIGSALIAHSTIFATFPETKMSDAEFSQLMERLSKLKSSSSKTGY